MSLAAQLRTGVFTQVRYITDGPAKGWMVKGSGPTFESLDSVGPGFGLLSCAKYLDRQLLLFSMHFTPKTSNNG